MRDDTPVLIGAGQFTFRGDPLTSPSPMQLLMTATERAASDAGISSGALAALDLIDVVGFAVDSPGGRNPLPRPKNPPRSLAKLLGADPRVARYSHMGGNTPQYLINAACERIARGESDLALIVGAEFLGSLRKRAAAGSDFAGWDDGETEPPERVGDPRPGVTPQEAAHGLAFPVNTYPLFENAYRAHLGRSPDRHQSALGELFAPFTKVAAVNPDAWFPIERSAEELITVSDRNRMVGYPYPKYLNAIMEVDQSAGVLLASVKRARELGVPEEKWVYLHGCADAADLWHVTERVNYFSSPAMRGTGERALAMAGKRLDDMAAFDLYSCFPVAVEIGAAELGLALDDPRGLTLTGGLPYFGGPGNNYVMHSVAAAANRCRARAGDFVMVTGNGWYLTKESVGIYSTAPLEARWERENTAVLQREIDQLPHPEVIERPSGRATIETYTVVHDRGGYRLGIVMGRDEEGRRFVANTPADRATLADLESREGVGRAGRVGPDPDGVRNLFTPE